MCISKWYYCNYRGCYNCPVFSQAAFEKHTANKFFYFLGSCLHTYLFAFATVSTWHGVWSVIERLTEKNLYAVIAVLVISYMGLALSRTSCNLKTSPFAIFTDFDQEKYNFDVPTYFQSLRLVSKMNHSHRYLIFLNLDVMHR